MLPPPILKQRIKMLNDIDFCWNSHQQASTDNWDEFYQLLLAYKAEHNGDLNIPFHYTTPDGFQLGHAAVYQRQRLLTPCLNKNGNGVVEAEDDSITRDRIAQLTAIGFPLSVKRRSKPKGP